MTLFIFLAGILLCLTLLTILLPLLRQTDHFSESLHKRLYTKRLEELENDKQRLNYSASEYQERLEEIQTQLLYDDEHKALAINEGAEVSRFSLVSISIFVLFLSGFIYSWLGAGKPAMSGIIPTVNDLASINIETLNAMEDKISKENASAAMLHQLGSLYFSKDAYADSERLFAMAIEKEPENSFFLSDYAETLIMLNNKQVSDKARNSLEKALSIDPHNPKALWLMALASAQENNIEAQLDYLQRLQSMLSPEDDVYTQINELINSVKSGSNNDPGTQPKITISINVAAEISNNINNDDIVFVYAKAIEGPPMPLAVAKFTYGELPEKIILNESMSMMPELTLSKYTEVEVTVLISKSGKIGINQGDLKGSVKPVAITENSEVAVTVDSIIQ